MKSINQQIYFVHAWFNNNIETKYFLATSKKDAEDQMRHHVGNRKWTQVVIHTVEEEKTCELLKRGGQPLTEL